MFRPEQLTSMSPNTAEKVPGDLRAGSIDLEPRLRFAPLGLKVGARTTGQTTALQLLALLGAGQGGQQTSAPCYRTITVS